MILLRLSHLVPLLLVLTVLEPAAPAGALPVPAGTVVAQTASAATPDVVDGHVEDIARSGTRVVLAGNFTGATDPGAATVLPRTGLLAFDSRTGVVDRAFAPVLDGPVLAVLPGPPGTVYVGGSFSTVGGLHGPPLLLLDLLTGAQVPGFSAPVLNGVVNDVRLSGGRLYVGGTFTSAGGAAHAGLVALDATTGQVDPFLQLAVAGHHNWPSPDPAAPGAKAPVGVSRLDIDPAGRRMVVLGNFTTVAGAHHDQVVIVDLSGASAAVAAWQTDRYDDPCSRKAYDSWVRDVDFSPDGRYFVIASTGGHPTTDGICDGAARWESTATGEHLQPTWVQWTGSDSLLSVAVTGPAVYVGGHQRWLNNAFGKDAAGPGAVGRPGIAALDPSTGLPLAWNPGRSPRGVGTTALAVTAGGLYVGSDTDWVGIGATLRHRRKVALFPYAGGTTRLPARTPGLPGTVQQGGQPLPAPTAPAAAPPAAVHDRLIPAAGPSGVTIARRTFDGTTAGPVLRTDDTTDWDRARGAFMVDGTVFYGWDDGSMHKRTVTNTTFGPDLLVDPYHDTAWEGVPTGSLGTTYSGAAPTFAADLPGVTSMFYATGRVYYALAGDRVLHARTFLPESGIVGSDQLDVDATADWSLAAGTFLDRAAGWLYVADARSGNLFRLRWTTAPAASGQPPVGRPTGTPTPVSTTGDWGGRAVFLTS